jgi:hypothetical protein
VERTGVCPGDYLFINLTDAGDIVIRPVKAREIHSGYAPVDSPQLHQKQADAADLDKW